MNIFVLLLVEESMVQRDAFTHDQWRGYMTVLVVNHEIIKSLSILTAVIQQMLKVDVDKPQDCFRQGVKWTLAIRFQLSTLSALDLDRIHHLPHALLPDKDTYCLPDRTQRIPNSLHRIQSGGDQKPLQCSRLLIE